MKKILGLTILVVLALSLAACSGGDSSSGSGLTGIAWQWTAMQETVPASQSVVPNPENYTITFNDDGTLALKADCNTGSGTYEVNGDSMKITLGALTRAYCGDASLDVIFLASLDRVDSYAIESGELQLQFTEDGGKMDFSNGGAAQ
jgi:heat shock protein HslJ